jgi:hypothetical protein
MAELLLVSSCLALATCSSSTHFPMRSPPYALRAIYSRGSQATPAIQRSMVPTSPCVEARQRRRPRVLSGGHPRVQRRCALSLHQAYIRVCVVLERARMMRTMMGVTLAAAMSCSAPLEHADRQPAVEAAVEPLLSDSEKEFCDSLMGQLIWLSAEAGREVPAALQAFEADPNSELVNRYFSESANRDVIHQRLIDMVQIGQSGLWKFKCEDPDEGVCLEKPRTLFYCLEGSCGHTNETDNYTMSACGDRFWADEYIEGIDDGDGASQTGLMVHELAHLAGALDDSCTQSEQCLIDTARFIGGGMVNYADAYRLYVMKSH